MLYPRLEDWKRQAQKGVMAVSGFLYPKELVLSERYLTGVGAPFASFGGYEGAERKRIYCLPEYMEGIAVPDDLSDYG
ncbi:MAG: hypothetical protein IJY42_02820, partial [Clostridia bacterium]|nr:hypothetical protein [Clostridia bacterium]